MTSDDEQFAAAMRFILEDVAARHQVIITSCHGQRHRALMQEEPELWNEHATLLRLSDPDPLRV